MMSGEDQQLHTEDGQQQQQQQAAQPGQPPVYIVIQSNRAANDKAHFAKTVPKKVMLGIGGAQIALAGLLVLSEVVLISSGSYHISGMGIWSGVPFAVAGMLGLLVGFRPSYCSVITFMVFNILTALLTIPALVFAGVGMSGNASMHRWRDAEDITDDEHTRKSVGSVFFAVEMLCGFSFGLLALAGSILSCRASCNCGGRDSGAGAGGGFVAYAPAPGQVPSDAAVVNIPMTAFAPGQGQPGVPGASGDFPPNYENAVDDKEGTKEYQRFQ